MNLMKSFKLISTVLPRITGLPWWALVLALFAGKLLAAAPLGQAATVPPEAAVAGHIPPTVPVPDDPLGRGTPHSSVEKFFGAARAGNFVQAARYLDLSRTPKLRWVARATGTGRPASGRTE